MSANPAASSPELNITLPSIRRLHGMIRYQERVLIKLLTGDQVPGKLRWIDFECLGFEPDLGEPMIIWQQAIAFIQVLEPRPRETQDLTLVGNQGLGISSTEAEEDPFAF